jgi:hypothetical protein
MGFPSILSPISLVVILNKHIQHSFVHLSAPL